jgi:hypothetical protein
MPTVLDIVHLKSTLYGWECVEYASTTVVLIGVVGEFIAEFTKFAVLRGLKDRIGKVSTLILIVGLSGELIALIRTSSLSGQLIAYVEGQSAQAIKDAASASDRAAATDLARVRLQEKMAWRVLSRKQKRSICTDLSPRFSKRMRVQTIYNDLEALQYALEFADTFKECGLWASSQDAGVSFMAASNPVVFGARIRGSPKTLLISMQERFQTDGVDIAGVDVVGQPTTELWLYIGPRSPP